MGFGRQISGDICPASFWIVFIKNVISPVHDRQGFNGMLRFYPGLPFEYNGFKMENSVEFTVFHNHPDP
jgi:hypothetical protein